MMNPASCCPALLSEYAAGTMDEGHALIVASYLSLCPEARARVGECQKLGGTMLETLCEPVGMKQGSLQNVLLRLEEEQRAVKGCAGAPAVSLCAELALPGPFCALLKASGAHLKWRALGGGSRMAVLPRPGCGSHVMVLHIAPGRRLPEHSHTGLELTLVLRGAYSDEAGHYPAGTLAVKEPDSRHTPVADARNGCICVTAVKGMVFSGWKGWVLNKFWR